MCARFFRKTYIAKILMVLLLLVPLTGCGPRNQPTASSHSTAISSNSSSLASNQSDDLSLNKTGVSIDMANLHIDSSGAQCPSGDLGDGPPDNPGPYTLTGFPGNNLVLATNRLTYDSSELNQMSDYIKTNTIPMPATLRRVLGGPIDMSRKQTNDAGHAVGYIYDCILQLGLTNTSQNLIQIAGVGVQLTGSTHQNDYQYHLIDPCTLPNLACGFGASETPCDQYFATIKLGLNSTSTVLSATPVGRAGPSCGELTLNPGGGEILVCLLLLSFQSHLLSHTSTNTRYL